MHMSQSEECAEKFSTRDRCAPCVDAIVLFIMETVQMKSFIAKWVKRRFSVKILSNDAIHHIHVLYDDKKYH